MLVQSGPYWSTADATKNFDLAPLDGYWIANIADLFAGNLYRFEITNSSATFQRIDPAAHDVVASELPRSDSAGRNASVVLTSEPSTWTPFDTTRFEDFIIYELHVGSFAGRNDGLEKSWSTFQDLERKLSYVRDLGFNCIELMPVHEFHLDRSWGYNPAAFFAPESSYGSPLQLRYLVDTAHRQGLAVVFDVIYNHAGAAVNPLLDCDGCSSWVRMLDGRTKRRLGLLARRFRRARRPPVRLEHRRRSGRHGDATIRRSLEPGALGEFGTEGRLVIDRSRRFRQPNARLHS